MSGAEKVLEGESASPLVGQKEQSPVAPCPPTGAAPDGGWGWMCVLGSAIVRMMSAALVRAFGVIYLALLAQYHQSATTTAWVGAINFAFVGFLGPLVSALCRKFSCRRVTIVGGLLAAAGLVSTGFAPNIFITYFTFGLMAGLGLGLAHQPSFIILGQYFDKRKALAMGIASFFSSVGALVFPPLLLLLFRHYGFAGMFLVLGACSLHICVAGALFRPLTPSLQIMINTGGKHKDRSLPENEENPAAEDTLSKPVITEEVKRNKTEVLVSNNNTETEGQIVKHMSDNKITLKERYKVLFKSPSFLAYVFLVFTLGYSLGVMSGFIPALAIENGVEEDRAAFLLSISGIAGMVMTIALAALLDVPAVRRCRLHICNMWHMVVGLTILLQGVVSQYAAHATLIALCSAAAGPRATLVSDLVGSTSDQEGLGLALMAGAAGSLLGRSLTGTFRDIWGSYNGAFILAGGLCLLSSTIFELTLVRRGVLARRKKSKDPTPSPELSIQAST